MSRKMASVMALRAAGRFSVSVATPPCFSKRSAASAPDARLVVMLRQPVEMFLSLHNQLLSNQIEDEPDAFALGR